MFEKLKIKVYTWLMFCAYRIEFTGEKSISGRPKYVFKPRVVPLVIICLLLVIPVMVFRGIICIFADSNEEIGKMFRVQNYSSQIKKDGETKWDLYKRF